MCFLRSLLKCIIHFLLIYFLNTIRFHWISAAVILLQFRLQLSFWEGLNFHKKQWIQWCNLFKLCSEYLKPKFHTFVSNFWMILRWRTQRLTTVRQRHYQMFKGSFWSIFKILIKFFIIWKKLNLLLLKWNLNNVCLK